MGGINDTLGDVEATQEGIEQTQGEIEQTQEGIERDGTIIIHYEISNE